MLKLRNPICFFDLETTGTMVSQDRIIEIAIIKLTPNGDVSKKIDLINPGMPIPAESSLIHGIHDEDVKDKPTFKEVAKEYAKFIEGADLGGFSIMKFDVPMLVEEFLRAGVEFDYSRKKIIDSQKIFHLMEKRTLSAAYRFYLDKDLQASHTAEADAVASLEILKAQVERYAGQTVTDSLGNKVGEIHNDMEALGQLTASDLVDLAGRMIKNKNGEEVFNFGKHKGKSVLAVLKDEPSYYDWIMNGEFPLDTKRKLTEIRLKGFKK
ncbi:MAG: 3'-5' exonuclease [Bacteroidia bacterium]|nr:3'-5' exonuclease [Bacteroidia bacterium]